MANAAIFNTAGYVNFNTKESISDNVIKYEIGQFNTQRLLTSFSVVDNEKTSSYVAAEYLSFDGPFESPQDFSRINSVWKIYRKAYRHRQN